MEKKRSRVSGADAESDGVKNDRKQNNNSYSINGCCLTKPCEIPLEVSHACELGFNFWFQNKYINDSIVSALLVQLLTNSQSACLRDVRNTKENNHVPNKVVFVSIHNFDPKELAEKLPLLSFLSSCSSMPVHHVGQLDQLCNSAQGPDKKWQYMDAESMNSLLLWPERTPLSQVALRELTTDTLFKTCSLVFRGEHDIWTDDVSFVKDETVTWEALRVQASQKSQLSGTSDKGKRFYEEILQKDNLETARDCVLGRMKRVSNGDSGMFVYSGAVKNSGLSSRLYLLWYKWEIEVLEGSDAVYGAEQSASLMFRKVLDASAAQDGTERNLSLELLRAVMQKTSDAPARDDHQPASETTNEPNDNIASLPSGAFTGKYQSLLAGLAATYEVLRTTSCAHRLEDLLLSEETMLLMGYPLRVDKEPGFVSTSSSQWAEPVDWSQVPAMLPPTLPVEPEALEEGEEMEDGEEEEEMETGDRVTTPDEDSDSLETETVAEAVVLAELRPRTYDRLDVCAIDCEMCATEAGLELTRVTVICPVRGVVYDSLVRPKRAIVDYNTEFSGITKELLSRVTVTLEDVHRVLRQLVTCETIIVGHSLDSDLKVLRLVHRRVIDTAALYPHAKGAPFKHSLKMLARDVLHKDIQEGVAGHDSVQDSAVSLELAFLKARYGAEVGQLAPWGESPTPRFTLFQQLHEALFEQTTTPHRLQIAVHSCPAHPKKTLWDQCALGFRSESSAEYTARVFQTWLRSQDRTAAEKVSVSVQSRSTNQETVENAIASLTEDRGSHHCHSLTWVDIVHECDQLGQLDPSPEPATGFASSTTNALFEAYSSSSSAKRVKLNEQQQASEEDICSMEAVDRALSRIYEASPAGTTFVAVTQGDMTTMRHLASQKMRNRWEYASQKKRLHLADCSRAIWDPLVDESRLIVAAAHAISGAVFIRRKPASPP